MEPPTRTYHLDLNRTLSEFFTKGFPAVDALLVISFTVKIVPHNKNKLSGWTAIVYLTSFLLSLCLHVVGMSSSRCIRGQQVQWRGGMMAYLSTVRRMLSAATLLLFLDYGVHSVAVLPPFLLAVAFVAALSWRALRTRQMRHLIGFNWGHFEQELKVGFNLSADVVSMAFAGLTGRVLGGGYKQLQGCRCGFMAVAPECLLFYGLVLGLLMVLLCTVPSRFEDLITRLLVAKVYKPLVPYLALLLLILASVVAAEDMLRINNASFVCFGIVAAAFAYLFWRKYQSLGGENAAASMADEEEGQRQHQLAAAAARRERDATLSQYILKGYITPLFSLVMATQSKYSIIDDDGAAGTLRAGCSNACCSWGCMSFLNLLIKSLLYHLFTDSF